MKDGHRVLLYSKDISVWDVVKLSCVAVFTPDVAVRCLTLAMDHSRIVCGVHDQHGVSGVFIMGPGRG